MSNNPTFAQARDFFEYMIGWKQLGAAGDETISTPYCPELRAFLQGSVPGIPQTSWSKAETMYGVLDHLRKLIDAFEQGPTT